MVSERTDASWKRGRVSQRKKEREGGRERERSFLVSCPVTCGLFLLASAIVLIKAAKTKDESAHGAITVDNGITYARLPHTRQPISPSPSLSPSSNTSLCCAILVFRLLFWAEVIGVLTRLTRSGQCNRWERRRLYFHGEPVRLTID